MVWQTFGKETVKNHARLELVMIIVRNSGKVKRWQRMGKGTVKGWRLAEGKEKVKSG